MKLRIIKDGNNIYHIQAKNSFFDSWEKISSYNIFSEEEAFMVINDMYDDIKRRKERKVLSEKIQVIQVRKV